MNSNIENVLLSPALVFQAGTIDLELLDRGLGEESRNFMRIHYVSEGDVEGAVYCYLIPYCFTLQYYTARVSGEPKPSSDYEDDAGVVMMFNVIKKFTECFLVSCRCQLYVIS